jgi:FkbM family methyltransferase
VKFFSQVGQDSYLLENFFRGKRGGVFVEIGAYDGETLSNTLFFERYMGWSGLCIEPLPSAFAKLKATRRAICEHVCVSDFEGEAEFVEAESVVDQMMLSGLAKAFDPRHALRLERETIRQVTWIAPVTRLSDLLAKHRMFDVDYCSIDTEGAEESILAEVDLDRFRIGVFTVENNYGDDRVHRIMEAKGYVFVTRLQQDLVFRRKDVRQLPRVSAICAVPHGIDERDALLHGHAANLAAQTVPVEPIYVFAGGDAIPDWLTGRAVAAGDNLTLYQAWNVALSMVATPFVMTLPLTARLAPDAAQILISAMQAETVLAVCGNWKICDTQAEADAVEPCYEVGRLAASGAQGWLRSGGKGSETLDPAMLWRMAAHMQTPRYPWRLRDGTLLHHEGEAAWRTTLLQMPAGRTVQVPLVIGNCLSAKTASTAPYDERALLNDPGVSFL